MRRKPFAAAVAAVLLAGAEGDARLHLGLDAPPVSGRTDRMVKA